LDWINTNIADGWCSGTNPTQAPATSGACDLRCVGTFSGNYLLNGLPATCSLGICTSTDGSNLCSALEFPCGVPTVAPTIAAPTTAAPTTAAPTTAAPTTKPPATTAPITKPPATTASTTKPPTTTAPTTKPPTTGVACDLTCYGLFSGSYVWNGIPYTCSLGICRSTDGSDLCSALGNPCASTTKPPATTAPTTKPPTTVAPTTKPPTTAAPTTAPICNLTCINGTLAGISLINGIQSTCANGRCYGSFSGNYQLTSLNGLPVPYTCSQGFCWATDGNDLCSILKYPCAPTTKPPTTAAPITKPPI